MLHDFTSENIWVGRETLSSLPQETLRRSPGDRENWEALILLLLIYPIVFFTVYSRGYIRRLFTSCGLLKKSKSVPSSEETHFKEGSLFFCVDLSETICPVESLDFRFQKEMELLRYRFLWLFTNTVFH